MASLLTTFYTYSTTSSRKFSFLPFELSLYSSSIVISPLSCACNRLAGFGKLSFFIFVNLYSRPP
jgi:hypothetical protein